LIRPVVSCGTAGLFFARSPAAIDAATRPVEGEPDEPGKLSRNGYAGFDGCNAVSGPSEV